MSLCFPGDWGLNKNKPINILSNREKSLDLDASVTSSQFVTSIEVMMGSSEKSVCKKTLRKKWATLLAWCSPPPPSKSCRVWDPNSTYSYPCWIHSEHSEAVWRGLTTGYLFWKYSYCRGPEKVHWPLSRCLFLVGFMSLCEVPFVHFHLSTAIHVCSPP